MDNLQNQNPDSREQETNTGLPLHSAFMQAPDLTEPETMPQLFVPQEEPAQAQQEAAEAVKPLQEAVPELPVEQLPEAAPGMSVPQSAPAQQAAESTEYFLNAQQEPVRYASEPQSHYRETAPSTCEPVRYEDTQEKPARPARTAAPRKKHNKSGGSKALKITTWIMVVAAAVCIGCVITGQLVSLQWQRRMETVEQSFGDQLAALEQQLSELENQRPSVVIGSTGASGEGLSPAQVYAMNVQSVVMIRSSNRTAYSTGSGFVLSEDGYVVTNHHVIEGGTELTVITADGAEYAATLVGSDNTNDVALLKVEAQGLQAAALGSSSELVVGDQVVAIGNPLGELTSTLTVGYVSAMERDVNTDGFAINMLQTDAAINSGNSGGPLFNMKGEVVGITTAKYSGTSSGGATIEGVGFAIPIDDVKDLISDLASYGYVTGAYMGVRVSDMDPAAANYYGLPVGAYVQSADPGSPAESAGIQSKDIIVKIGDYEVGSVNELTRALRNFQAGDTTVVVVYRGGREVKLTITLIEKPAA